MRLFLADDHPVVRSGLRALMESEPDMTIVGEAADGFATVEGALQLRPDVVIMDVSMPKLGGAEATERIRKECPETKVLALTAHEERSYVQLLLAAGASGYVLKRSAAEDLVRAVHAVAAGGVYLDPAMAAQVVSNGRRPGAASNVLARAELSEREAEVMRLIARGHAMKEIATMLELSTRTLETYKARAMEKLDLKSRADIVRYALERGWLKSS